MIFTYDSKNGRQPTPLSQLSTAVIWYDLLNPTPEEISAIEETLSIEIPDQEEMQEIEFSSRCYVENGTSYMTINVVVSAESETPESIPMTFIINEKHFITLRYSEPKSLDLFIKKLEKNHRPNPTSYSLFIALLDVMVDRLADIVEVIAEKLETLSKKTFVLTYESSKLKESLITLGKEGDLSAKVRLTLDNLNRMLKFLSENVSSLTSYETLKRDVASISENLTFIFQKINFLLEATLGLINIQQNSIVKIFSIAAVIFLPPTLIASIYGMNFKSMPELGTSWGYPLILIIMTLSAILPYLYFKRKGWFK